MKKNTIITLLDIKEKQIAGLRSILPELRTKDASTRITIEIERLKFEIEKLRIKSEKKAKKILEKAKQNTQPVDNQIGWDKCDQKEEKKEPKRNLEFWENIDKEHKQEIREAEKRAFEAGREQTNEGIEEYKDLDMMFEYDTFEDYLKSETKTAN